MSGTRQVHAVAVEREDSWEEEESDLVGENTISRRNEDHWFKKFLCPNKVKKCRDVEEVQARYDNYQSFLNTLMTVGTLLMGFILTGTLLNFTYDGKLRRTEFAAPFDKLSLTACVFATTSVVVSLLVSVRSNVIFRDNGPVRALRAMMNSTVWMGFAELSVYISIGLFLESVVMYLEFAQRGPSHICVSQRGEASDCVQLSRDLSNTVVQMCADWQDGLPATLSNDSKWRRGVICSPAHPLFNQNFTRRWHPHFNGNVTRRWLRVYKKTALMFVRDIVDVLCRKSVLSDVADELCRSPYPEGKTACAEASVAAFQADACLSDNFDTALLCQTICQDERNLKSWMHRYTPFAEVAFGIIIVFRVLRISQQVVATYHFRRNEDPCCLFVKELGVYDHFESDNEEENLVEHPGERDKDVAKLQTSRQHGEE